MKILIDMQGAQTQSALRGIGRYSRALVRALLEAGREECFYLLLNERFPRSAAKLREEFAPLLPPERFLSFCPEAPTAACFGATAEAYARAEAQREACIAAISPDWLLITSLFEGAAESAVTSVPSGGQHGIRTAVLFYDLIPYLDPQTYLTSECMRRWYEEKLLSLRRADRLLAISDSAAGEVREHLGEVLAAKTVTVSSGYNRFFSPGRSHPGQWRRYGIVRPYLMHVGVYGKRKNFEGLIRAFSLLPKKLQKRYQLLLVCKADKKRHRRLREEAARCGLSDDALVLTDYLPDRELRMLYRGAALFVFPSLHEGFGLPPLEAMACGTATVAGDNSSLPEVLPGPGALFDAARPGNMAQRLATLLHSGARRRQLARQALKHASMFSWEQTAARVRHALCFEANEMKKNKFMHEKRKDIDI